MLKCLKTANFSHKIFLTCISSTTVTVVTIRLFFYVIFVIGFSIGHTEGGNLPVHHKHPHLSAHKFQDFTICKQIHSAVYQTNSQFAHSQAPSLLQNVDLGESSAEPERSADCQFTSHTKVVIDSTPFRHCCS